jgi:outer membrane assembly lipoprotein YfiO
MRRTLVSAFLGVVLVCSWGCIQKTAKLQKSVVPPDKTLFETGEDYLHKSQYIKARLALQTLMNTYPDSDLAPDALMAIGDSYYDEGGTENLLQAEDSYKNFIVFFPANPKAPDAALKVIALNHRMMRSPDRDQQYSFKTEDAIRKFLAQFPDSDYVPIVNRFLLEVQENLALGNLGVGQFYEGKGNLAGAKQRYQEILDKQSSFSQLDEVLFRTARILEVAKNPDEAARDYQKIVSAYPFSKHVDDAKARLQALGKPVPQVDMQLAAANQARVKPAEGFSPLKPFIEFGKALGFVAPPDIYQQAKKEREEEKAKTAAAEARKEGGEQPGTGGDIQIRSTIYKSANGETRDTTVLANGSDPTPQETPENKKESTRTRKKKVKKSE